MISFYNINFKKKGVNIIAMLKGKSKPDEWYIVGAHIDSTSERPSDSAPGKFNDFIILNNNNRSRR